MKQELDNLDRLFVEHYKSMKAKKDVVVAPYEGSDTGVLRMEYDMVTEQIHILLKFDKANKMYNFRSERQYPSMDQEAAYHFAMDIAEKYDGFRCNAYDNTVIIQHVGTFRDMEETQAAALLKKSMESFERIAMEKLTEFGDLCGITEPEDAGEIIELPPDHTGETEYDTYELPKPPADRAKIRMLPKWQSCYLLMKPNIRTLNISIRKQKLKNRKNRKKACPPGRQL